MMISSVWLLSRELSLLQIRCCLLPTLTMMTKHVFFVLALRELLLLEKRSH